MRASNIEGAAQSALLRDIFGNPFRPITSSTEWSTDTTVSLVAALAVLLATWPAVGADLIGPWDIKALKAAEVKPEWGKGVGKAKEVFYPGEPFRGKATQVFAYYARHATGDGPFPAVLLVHGGGGKAFQAWAEHWAARDYCALAMDLSGNGPNGPLADGGPDQSDDTKFRDFNDKTVRDMWTYHAVAAVLRDHTLLRISVRIRLPHSHIWTFGEVDAFIDSHLKKGAPLPGIGAMTRTDDTVSAKVTGKVKLETGQLHYAIADGPWQEREWKSLPAEIKDGVVSAKLPADRPLVYELPVTDDRGLEVSAPHAILKDDKK